MNKKRRFSLFFSLSREEKLQIGLNILSFVVFLLAEGGEGSFMAYLAFSILIAIIVIENAIANDRTMMVMMLVKLLTNIGMCIILWKNKGMVQWHDYVMLLTAIGSLLFSYHLKKRWIAISGIMIAITLADAMYLLALYKNPHDFGGMHALLWCVQGVSYFLSVKNSKKDAGCLHLVIPVYAVLACIVFTTYIVNQF